MNNKPRRRGVRRSRNQKPCTCKPEFSFPLFTLKEIMDLPTADSLSFSIKTYAAAYFTVMREYPGVNWSEVASGILEMCSANIAMGHRMESNMQQEPAHA
jgi:hypothetical protein